MTDNQNANVVVGEVVPVSRPVRPELRAYVNLNPVAGNWVVSGVRFTGVEYDCEVIIPGSAAPPPAPVGEDAETLKAFAAFIEDAWRLMNSGERGAAFEAMRCGHMVARCGHMVAAAALAAIEGR